MGNRGILHDPQNEIVRPWKHKSWVTCLLSYGGIKRPRPFSKGNYSELFFLDEATSFSAGHRPCAYCQRIRNREFKLAWVKANMATHDAPALTMPDLDKSLHLDRVKKDGSKKTFRSGFGRLPVGTFFEHDGAAMVKSDNGALPWSFSGYGGPVRLAEGEAVTVLTPSTVVKAFAAGFVPHLHASAGG